MKKILLISLLLFSKIAFSQVSDSFDDGNFTQNPSWSGDTNNFQINEQKQLQSKGQQLASQTISLSTTNQLSLNASWEFLVRLNFNPTTTNFVRIYLTSDKQDLKGSLNGYFVQIGETGSTDGFHLYKQTGTSTTRIITGPQKNRATAAVVFAKIKVTRNAAGRWELYTDITGGNNFNLEGSVTDNTFTSSAFAGVFCRYTTATRYNQYFFDDFKIEDLTPDTTPPFIKNVVINDTFSLDVTFSEALEANSAILTSNYNLLPGYGNPLSIAPTASSNVYRLTFPKDFISGDYILAVKNIKDVKGNVIAENSSVGFTYIKPYSANYGDVVINEIFANPTGSPALPQKEFVEIWNTTNEYILTKDWKYADQTSVYTFLTDTLKPNQHVILTAKADEGLFQTYGKTIGLSPWPSLNNDKDVLTLSDHTGKVIDKVAYYDTWYKDDVKKKGGYSLELIDPKNICGGIQNWAVSTDASGGTPGKANSIYRTQLSTEIPKILSATITDSVTVQVVFSKAVDSLSAVQTINYSINNGMGSPKTVAILSPDFNLVTLQFSSALTRGVEHTLSLTNLTDCAGNIISPTANTAKLFIARKIAVNDILISEILFNPKSGSVDFVEIYNNTDHVLDLKDLQLANADANGKAGSIKNLSAKNSFILPKTYWVISTNTASIKANYICENPDNFVQLASLPSYNNDKGTVILLNSNLQIDRFDYNEKMHVALLQNPDGVSLERVSFLKGANEKGNFKSAAASVGFATPTYKNSQEPNGDESYVKLQSKTFSPDGDNYEDVLSLDYQVTENTSFATVLIYSDKGRLVKSLMKNQSIGTKGTLSWDGFNDTGQKAAVGIYVILFDVFDLSGKTKRFKNTCVLAAKLN
ncbi:lamin tail domain-containing protein [Pedobacter aquatilis]|uniref:lamin tail domain-containing protein n=1 Tax=Pedobacter aquatilis TaxID=351343 RepID=UPI00292D5E29|nr:lamin tail domain-containing protein [Pedobacter aquatilis]